MLAYIEFTNMKAYKIFSLIIDVFYTDIFGVPVRKMVN